MVKIYPKQYKCKNRVFNKKKKKGIEFLNKIKKIKVRKNLY
jgi:hypothetical protein